MADIVVLGAGMAGVSAAHHAKKAGWEAVVFEARERWGGLLDHFNLDGFRFDRAVHLAFTDDPYVQAFLDRTVYITHETDPYNYERGRWLKHPVQNNLFPLPVDEKVAAIRSFIERPELNDNGNYRDWLVHQFGKVIAERFPVVYTEKYWTVPPEELSTDWVGNRVYRPSLEEVLYGAMSGETPLTYYIKKMYYPRKGGFRAFLDPLAAELDIRTGKRAILIDPKRKYVQFADGGREYYENLVSSVPLPELVTMIEDAPEAVKEAAASLWATSVGITSVGFKVPRVTDHLWFYIYDPSIIPARVHSPGLKSPDNVPEGCSSVQFEAYFSRRKPLVKSPDDMIEHTVTMIEKLKMASRSDIAVIDFRVLPYGNVVFDRGMTGRRDLVKEYLESRGILLVGRFGEWDYLWSNQSYLSGKKVELITR